MSNYFDHLFILADQAIKVPLQDSRQCRNDVIRASGETVNADW